MNLITAKELWAGCRLGSWYGPKGAPGRIHLTLWHEHGDYYVMAVDHGQEKICCLFNRSHETLKSAMAEYRAAGKSYDARFSSKC